MTWHSVVLAGAPWLLAGAVTLAVCSRGDRAPARRLLHLVSSGRDADGRVFRPSTVRQQLAGVRTRRSRATRTDVAAVVSELAALVRAGVPPAGAWGHAVAGARDDAAGVALVAAAAAAASGLPVGDELQRHALTMRADAAAELQCLAGSWRVCEATGSPMAEVLDRVAHTVREDADRRDARTTALAAPLATARVLAALPFVGLVLGQLMGAAPLAVLLGTPPGRVSGVVGLVFATAGVLWTRRLMRSASRSP